MRLFYSLFFFLTFFYLLYPTTYGKSYLSIRPHFESGSTERINIDHFLQQEEPEKKHSFNIVPFGGKTTSPQDLAEYFLPTDKPCMTIAEDYAHCARDINANFLGIASVPLYNQTGSAILNLIPSMTYHSNLILCPKRQEVGVGFLYRYQLPRSCWFDISTAVIHLRHNLNPCEQIINNGGEGPNGFCCKNLSCSMSCTTQFCYGKIVNCIQKKTGVPQVELRIGATAYHDHHILTAFLGIDIPTGKKPCQKYMFEPIVGNNKHVGGFVGFEGIHYLSKTTSHAISLSADLLFRYLFPNTQLRSFDLKNRPWSRYLWVWRNNNDLSNPSTSNVNNALNRLDHLINYSTLCAEVSPQAHFDGNISLNFNKNNWHIELGYHLYASQAEEICLKSNICDHLGIEAFAYYLQNWSQGEPQPVTRSFNMIQSDTFAAQPDVVDYIYNATNQTYNATYQRITCCDIDLNSAATPGQFIQTLYASAGYTWQREHPLLANLGASYDFSANNNAPSQWLLWLQLGIWF